MHGILDLTFQSRIKQDGIELLKAVEKYALDFDEKVHNMFQPCVNSLINTILTIQRVDESLHNYYTQFKANWKLMNTHAGDCAILFDRVKVQSNPLITEDHAMLWQYRIMAEACDKKLQAYQFVMNAANHKTGPSS